MSNSPIISILVAVADNGIIGMDGDMPWQLSTDLKRFKAVTMGKPIIMGRKTFESIGKPLPGRLNVIISRDPNYGKTDDEPKFAPDKFQVTTSLAAAIKLANARAKNDDIDEICVIGGGEIYRQAIEMAKKLYVTHVMLTPKGDTSFPKIDDTWQSIYQEEVPKGEKDSAATRFVIYSR